jgi:hypothetical protein
MTNAPPADNRPLLSMIVRRRPMKEYRMYPTRTRNTNAAALKRKITRKNFKLQKIPPRFLNTIVICIDNGEWRQIGKKGASKALRRYNNTFKA